MMPSNWEAEMLHLKKRIQERLNAVSDKIVKEECAKILGRIKILTQEDMGSGNYEWFIEPSSDGEEK